MTLPPYGDQTSQRDKVRDWRQLLDGYPSVAGGRLGAFDEKCRQRRHEYGDAAYNGPNVGEEIDAFRAAVLCYGD